MNGNAGPVFRLVNTIRNYAWGSYDGLARFAGIEQEPGKPSAECWMGSHPDAPSSLLIPGGERLSLQKFIREYPIRTLGEEVFSEFGDLPFLFKVLSASMPLSIQVHPDREKAERGFDGEELRGIARTAPERNYRDRNHKPELAVALSGFSAICGFRRAEETAEFLGPQLCSYFAFSPSEPEKSFRALLGKVLILRDREKAFVENAVAARARELALAADGRARLAGETSLLCFRHYPHDLGACSPLFLEVRVLEPGQGLYVPAGVMHAYLEGTILEVMATSDNVIRGGLTHKHIDVEEFLSILDVRSQPLLVEPVALPAWPGEMAWPTPAREFSLSRMDFAGTRTREIRPAGPEILLCTDGSVTIDYPAFQGKSGSGSGESRTESLILGRGESVFIAAACRAYSLSGKGRVYRTGTGGDPEGAPR